MACGNCGARGDTYQLDSYGPDMEGTSQPTGLYTSLEEGYQIAVAPTGGAMSTSSLALVLLGAMAVGGAVAVVATRNRRY